MATDPKKTLPPPTAPATLKTDIDKMLETGMADFSIRVEFLKLSTVYSRASWVSFPKSYTQRLPMRFRVSANSTMKFSANAVIFARQARLAGDESAAGRQPAADYGYTSLR